MTARTNHRSRFGGSVGWRHIPARRVDQADERSRRCAL